ncbi:MAG: NAD(+) synthase [Gemmatimonadetes bacterium]|nr:MAG: NAD(+) synthase [Gemmatimonadota bacterium]
MRLIKIGIGCVNSKVGAFRENTRACIDLIERAQRENVSVLVLPELALCGYNPDDLSLWVDFVDANWDAVHQLVPHTEGMFVSVGLLINFENKTYNAAAAIHDRKLIGVVLKEQLPNYDVFYEGRTLARGFENFRIDLNGVPAGDLIFHTDCGDIALEICEDLWTPDGPSKRRAYAGAELILNSSASPFRVGVKAIREHMLATRSADHECIYVYSSLVGGNDRLVFDGGGFVYQNGRQVLDAPRFEEGLFCATVDVGHTMRIRRENTTWRNNVERFYRSTQMPHVITSPGKTTGREKLIYPLPSSKNFFLPDLEPLSHKTAEQRVYEELLNALILGTKDYFEKTGAFKKFVVALSGGKDSALCAFIAQQAIRWRYPDLDEAALREKIRTELTCFYLPTTAFSTKSTENAAAQLAAELGATFKIVSIQDEFEIALKKQEEMLLDGENISDLSRQNTQARIRGSWMWNYSNSTGAMILITSNMSEGAVGYTTLGGDEEGCFAPLLNVPKTMIIKLLDYAAETYHLPALRSVNELPPSAELAADQTDEVDLMPYDILDVILYLFGEEKLDAEEILQVLIQHFPEIPAATLKQYVDKFIKLFFQNQYKREQFALGIKLYGLDLEPKTGFRFPVVQSSEWAR